MVSRMLAVMLISASVGAVGAGPVPGFTRSPFFHEQVRMETLPTGIRMLTNLPQVMRADRPTLVIFFATPNGNTIEQTMGCAMVPDLDWHFDIQHVAAQVRVLRDLDRTRNIVLVCMEAEGLSWPTWRSKHDQSIIRETLERVMNEMPGTGISAVITGHSGGGSLITGFINSYDAIPSWVERIAYLDANYSYSDEEKHGDKLLAWLKGGVGRRLVVIAYDDREITFEGKKVVGPTGGTYRASHRMITRFGKDLSVKQGKWDVFDRYDLWDKRSSGRVAFFLHPNPENKILHTALVGEMNGLLQALTLGTAWEATWGSFGGPRAYTRWVQPAPTSLVGIPKRRANAHGGKAVMESVAQASLDEREAVLLKEIRQGNVPEFMREFVPIKVKVKDANGRERTVVLYATPDYLSVGSDADFVRTPLTPDARAEGRRCLRLHAPHAQDGRRHPSRGEGPSRADPPRRAAHDCRDVHPTQRDDRGAEEGQGAGGSGRRDQEGRRDHQPARGPDGPRGDLRLVSARRQADSAAHLDPRQLVRRLQPRDQAREADGLGRWESEGHPRGARRSRTPSASERRGADHRALLPGGEA